MYIGGKLARINTALVEIVLYAETILSAASLCPEKCFFWINGDP